MRYLRMMPGVIAVVGILAIATTPASGAEFQASKTGIARGLGTSLHEVFRLNPLTVTCIRSTSVADVEELKSETLKNVVVKYHECKTFANLVVNVSPAAYEYAADGMMRIEEPIVFTVPDLQCTATIEAQVVPSPTALFTGIVEYGGKQFPDGQQKLDIGMSLRYLSYKASNWPCAGPTKEEQPEEREGQEGKFTGEMQDEIPGGNLTWVK